MVKFNCTYVGDIVRWEANGQKIFDGQNGFEITEVPLTSTSAISTLAVVTSLDKNNTNLTCIVLTLDLSIAISDPALLLLQGKSFMYEIDKHMISLNLMFLLYTYNAFCSQFTQLHVYSLNNLPAVCYVRVLYI